LATKVATGRFHGSGRTSLKWNRSHLRPKQKEGLVSDIYMIAHCIQEEKAQICTHLSVENRVVVFVSIS
jgi:hypothetical protein